VNEFAQRYGIAWLRFMGAKLTNWLTRVCSSATIGCAPDAPRTTAGQPGFRRFPALKAKHRRGFPGVFVNDQPLRIVLLAAICARTCLRCAASSS
jgi:hypothetical protein